MRAQKFAERMKEFEDRLDELETPEFKMKRAILKGSAWLHPVRSDTDKPEHMTATEIMTNEDVVEQAKQFRKEQDDWKASIEARLAKMEKRADQFEDRTGRIVMPLKDRLDKLEDKVHERYPEKMPDPKPESEPECCDVIGCKRLKSVQYRGVNFCEKHGSCFVSKDVIDNLCKYPIHPKSDPKPEPECTCVNLKKIRGESIDSWDARIENMRKWRPVHFGFVFPKLKCKHLWKYPYRGYGKIHIQNKTMKVCSLCGITGSKPDPASPLRVEVAKTLGKEIIYANAIPRSWDGTHSDNIPPYDTDLTAAMGALEEYCRKNNIVGSVSIPRSHKLQFYVFMGVGGMEATGISHSLPTAICGAIVKHHKGVE